MLEALSTAVLGIVIVAGGLYAALRWIVLAGLPDPRALEGSGSRAD